MNSNQPLPEYWTPEPIIGWRMWRTSDFMGRPNQMLASIVHGDYWHDEMPPAVCLLFKPHAAPNEGCICGYWSMKQDTITDPETWGRKVWSLIALIQMGVAGYVRQWGQVIEYEQGYRSEQVAVESLIVFDREWLLHHVPELLPVTIRDYGARVRQHADRLGVPVVHVG